MKSFVFFWLPTAITWTCAVVSLWFVRKNRSYWKERAAREAKFMAELEAVVNERLERGGKGRAQ